jgi:YesN/AraC family two-component response regulator
VQRSKNQKFLSVKEIAKVLRYNPDYLSSEYKKRTGVPLKQYINKVRVAMAKNLLVYDGLSVKEAAYTSGFKDAKYFAKVFKHLEKITPIEYKKKFSQKIIHFD